MSASHHSWLHEQIPSLEREGILSADSAERLRTRYPLQGTRESSFSQMVMGALGALLIGAGLIAVIGYNWDDFSRPVRLSFAFVPLLVAQCLSWWVLRRGDEAVGWLKETAALFQVLTGGACLAIVSQIYNLGGEWPDLLFWWMILSLPVLWLMRSAAVAVFYLAAIATWAVGQSFEHQPWYHGALLYPILLLGLVPYWPGFKLDQSISVALRWIIAVSACFGLVAANVQALELAGGEQSYFRWGFAAVLWLNALTAAIFALLPISRAAQAEPSRRKPQVVLGFLYLLPYALGSSFLDNGNDVASAVEHAVKTPWGAVLALILVGCAVYAVVHKRWAALSMSAVAVLPVPLAFAGLEEAIPWAMTLLLFAIGVALIALEFAGRPGAPRLGAFVLCAVLICRMAESDISLLAKGLAFIAIGVGFLVSNVAISRHLRNKNTASILPS